MDGHSALREQLARLKEHTEAPTTRSCDSTEGTSIESKLRLQQLLNTWNIVIPPVLKAS